MVHPAMLDKVLYKAKAVHGCLTVRARFLTAYPCSQCAFACSLGKTFQNLQAALCVKQCGGISAQCWQTLTHSCTCHTMSKSVPLRGGSLLKNRRNDLCRAALVCKRLQVSIKPNRTACGCARKKRSLPAVLDLQQLTLKLRLESVRSTTGSGLQWCCRTALVKIAAPPE